MEEYDTRKQKEDWGVQISTALSSTQVVDGFMVKETKNINDTIAYLTGLTEELCRAHEASSFTSSRARFDERAPRRTRTST